MHEETDRVHMQNMAQLNAYDCHQWLQHRNCESDNKDRWHRQIAIR